MSEWKKCTLGDVLNLRRGYDLPHSKMMEGNIPVAGSNGIIGTHNIATPIEPCITVGRSGSAGSTFIYDRAWAHNTTLYIDDFKGNDPKYLYYLLLSLPLNKMAGGSAVPSLNRNHIHPLNITFPTTLETQHKIASILTSLDDKIAINRRICENLEAQAQALFKHWFIDFTPFKDGQFVESELGMIPEGWSVGTLTEIAEYLNGLAMQKFPPISDDDAIPVLKIKELGQSQCDNNSDKCSKQIKQEYIIKNGDVVFSWSGTLMVDIWCGGICGLNQHLFKVTSDNYPKWFYLMWTKHHLAEFVRIAKDKAVTMGHIKRGDLEKALVAIPDSDTLDKMSKVMEDIHNQIINTRLESNALSTLRDTLLPKLMSGELKVNITTNH